MGMGRGAAMRLRGSKRNAGALYRAVSPSLASVRAANLHVIFSPRVQLTVRLFLKAHTV